LYDRGIVRAKVLLIVAHPVVGSGLETLLRLEERFEVKRVGRLVDTQVILAAWRPDLALVDGVLLQGGQRLELGVPSVVLSGSAVDGSGLVRMLDEPRGWLRKDATIDELADAIDRALGTPPLTSSTVVAALAVVLVGILLAWGYLALRSSV
jgi:DNA-binding NarL/FixJ family response regulator